MSRIGRLPIKIPENVELKIENDTVYVKGPKGELSEKVTPELIYEREGDLLYVKRPSDSIRHRSFHGLTRTLINNMIIGVTQGYSKALEINGVGYKAEPKGKGILLALGYSHNIYFVPPEGVKLEVPSATKVVVSGIDKQLVGLVAAKIRSFRPPEPYKGKGIRYEGEEIRRKAGKTAG